MLSKLARWWHRKDALQAQPACEHVHISDDSRAFDAEWYLAAYPDVAASGMAPQEHYKRHGKAEGRSPCRNRVPAWGHALWRGAHQVILARLFGLLDTASANTLEQTSARWELARWYAWQGEGTTVVRLLTPNDELIKLSHPGPALLLIDAVMRLAPTTGPAGAVQKALGQLQRSFPSHPDTPLARANALGISPSASAQRMAIFNGHLQEHGLVPLTLVNPNEPLHLDNIVGSAPESTASPLLSNVSYPLISVIIPLYNAAATISTALKSLFAQQGVRLDIIVVDDASLDESARVVERLQVNVPVHVSLRLIRHSTNQGAYAARNTGLAVAEGEYITTHDSDDWSHPQKLAKQCQVLLDHSSVKACLSHWVRVTPELLFHRWRLDEYGWVYPNMSSLMFRREVRNALGYWDNVSVNADSEYRQRIEAAYGKESLCEVLPGVPLSLGRADGESLSQHARSHLVSQFSGMRFNYMQAAHHWYQKARTSKTLFMPVAPEKRLFTAPPEMLRTNAPSNPQCADFERVLASKLFDAGWYLERYIDLQQVRIEPLTHFWEHGGKEGRDPGPDFSSSGYLRDHPEVVDSGRHPLAHYLSQAQPEPNQALPIWDGARAFEGRPTIMLCGHQTGNVLFGAERSLLDVLDAMVTLRWNVVVTLPEANNAPYEQALLRRCKTVAVLPYGWWQVGRQANETTVAHFQSLLTRYDIQAVHGNTVVLQEPYVAARRHGIPTLIHVRELPAHDEALCDLLGATANDVVAHVHAHADVIIANSNCVAKAFEQSASSARIRVVPNTVEMRELRALPEVAFSPDGAIRVGMLSSNVAKKGLADIEVMARYLQTLEPAAKVMLYGPLTPAIQWLEQRQAQGKAPGNISYAGYVSSPEAALAELDIVVNLSRFQESFGRTVLEAMAAGRPVVAYNWGALSELIADGKTGYLVPYASPLQAAKKVAKLARSPRSCRKMGVAARARAERHFGALQLRNALENAYRSVLPN